MLIVPLVLGNVIFSISMSNHLIDELILLHLFFLSVVLNQTWILGNFSSGSFLGILIIRYWSSIIEAYIVVVIVELSEGLVDWKLQNAWIHSFKHESCVDFLKYDF